MRDSGYHTYMGGKWHLGHEPGQYPSDQGFERVISLLNGGGSHYSDISGLMEIENPVKYLQDGEPLDEIRLYIKRKLDMARDYPRESRLFASEILQGAPRLQELLSVQLKSLVDEKVKVIQNWMEQGKLAKCSPYHLIFSIWSTTQHYADFDAQLRVILTPDKYNVSRFEDAEQYLEQLFVHGLKPAKQNNITRKI